MKRYKYPRTYHLPFSPGATSDDRYIENFDAFKGQEIVVTEKMDGENTTIYSDGYTHARSIDSGYHQSRSLISQTAASILYLWETFKIPQSYRITGENLYAKHSIQYTNLKSYFYMFGVWHNEVCLSWDETEYIASCFNLTLVPILYRGPFDLVVLKSIEASLDKKQEGFVVRLTDEIYGADWDKAAAKWVRPDHVQTVEHWMSAPVIKNKLVK